MAAADTYRRLVHRLFAGEIETGAEMLGKLRLWVEEPSGQTKMVFEKPETDQEAGCDKSSIEKVYRGTEREQI